MKPVELVVSSCLLHEMDQKFITAYKVLRVAPIIKAVFAC